MKTASERSAIAAIVLLATFAAFFFYHDYQIDQEAIRLEREEERKSEEIKNTLESLDLFAKAVSVYDATLNKKIYGRNDDVPLPIASLAKTMTILVALEENEGDETISISSSAISQSGDYGLFSREKWKLADLAKLTLVASANDGAYALGEQKENFLEKMQDKAKLIGMDNSSFLNFTGLDIPAEADSRIEAGARPGAFASASDVNAMSIRAFHKYPEVFGATILSELSLSSESSFIHNIKNTNTSIDNIPGLLFSKTGYTALANGNLAVIFRNREGNEIAVTVLGSTYLGRFEDVEKIVKILH